MTRQRLLVAGLLLIAVVVVAGLLLVPRLARHTVLTGYIEGEPLYLAAPIAGTVKAMYVVRGQDVAAGAKLFAVDPQQPVAARDQAAAQVAAAQAQAVDARKGQRPLELAVLDANIAAAEAKARDADAALRRVATLAAKGYESKAALDDAKANAQAAAAQTKAARKQRDAATLGSRADQVRAADARVSETQAGLTGAAARLSDNAPSAPSAARVEDVFFQQGEWAPANQPILSLLPDDRIKVRFFVPEPLVGKLKLGQRISVHCDGCESEVPATITFISTQCEYTPPVIYSNENRSKLVFMVIAKPPVERAAALHPGQPLEVTLQ